MRALRVLPVLFLITASLHAAPRVTSLDGREVVIRSANASRAPKLASLAARRPQTHANVTINAGPDTDAANNDYRRIQNAINAAGPGDVITLAGTFDFTASFAAAAWALGNDNTASTADDYSVYVPAGLNNVTLTATGLGAATIQGPGDLPALDLEGFLVFDGGDNQNWTISNLRILDFDLGIGMFAGAGGVDAFDNTVIQTNFIRLASDLNAVVAPADALQNIGIHYAFGVNQTIYANTIQSQGNAASSGASTASDVGMQSNTSGGSVYDGLNIGYNTIDVLNPQNAQPQVILGIWENGYAHTSDIVVQGNTFNSNIAGNDSALNLERGICLTSHSGAATTVTYDQNFVTGASIGFQWATASNFAGNQAVVLNENTITHCGTGVLVQSNGIAHFTRNTFNGSGAGGSIHVITGDLTGSGANPNSLFENYLVGGSGDGIWIEATAGSVAPMLSNHFDNTGFGLRNESAPAIVAELNYWGNNLAANVAAEVSGNADFDPWLASGTDQDLANGFQPFAWATTTGTITTFAGSPIADTGGLLGSNPINMLMNGQTAFTPAAELLNFDIQLGDSDDQFTLGQTGIPTIFDGGAGNDTLFGTSVAQAWNITGANSGNIPGAATSFVNVESLTGGTDADTFVFGAAGSIAGALDGSFGSDTLNNSAIPAAVVNPTGPGTLDGLQGTATGVGTTFDNIDVIASPGANLTVVKTAPASANPSAPLAYGIDVINNGAVAASNVSLTDVLPAGVTFTSLVAPGGWSCTPPPVNTNGTVTCTILSLPVGTASFTINVTTPATGTSIVNSATVTSTNESSPGDETGTATTTLITNADLSITKSGPATLPQSGLATYTITVTNHGPAPATNVVVTDTLPAGVTYDDATPSQGTCTGTTTVTCNLGGLANGASATITLGVVITASGGTITNTAAVSAVENDPTPADNSGNATGTAVPAVAAIPTASMLGLLALLLGVAWVGVRRL